MRMVRDWRGRAGLAAALVGAVVLAGCAAEGGTSGVAAERVLIGAAISTSGPAAFAGVPVQQGIELAIEQANEKSVLGEGIELDLEVVDVAADPAKAIAAYRQFDADGAAGVLCCTLGSEAGALRPVLTDSVTPGVVTVSILEDLADPPHLFRPFEVPSAPGGLYDEFLDAVFGSGKFSSAVVVVNDDNDAMVQDARIYADGLRRNGVTVLDSINVATAETSFTSVATGIVAEDPDVVVASTIGSSTAALARSLRERGYDGPIVSNVGADSANAYEASAGTMEGTIFPTPYHADFPVGDAGVQFARDYEAAYGTSPDMFAAHGFTAAQMLIEALANAESHEPQDVGAALSALATMESVYGVLDFTAGQAEVQGSALHLVWGEDGAISEWSPDE